MAEKRQHRGRYDQAVSYWQELFRDLLAETNLTYTSYLNTITVDGTSLRDGNPIFDAYFPGLQKAIRIIQEEPDAENEPEIGAWLQETEITPHQKAYRNWSLRWCWPKKPCLPQKG